jgi:hypothetical protein
MTSRKRKQKVAFTPFDKAKHYLGALCKRGHDYKGTGKSKRLISIRACCLCQNDLTNEWKKKNRDKVNRGRRKWWSAKTEEEILDFYKRHRNYACVNSEKLRRSKAKYYRTVYKGSSKRRKVLQKYHQRRDHWREVINYAETLSKAKRQKILELVDMNVELKIAQLDVERLLRKGEQRNAEKK